jgi:exodeoxyribonuclease-3
MRLFTWNVNGIRSVGRKGLLEWLAAEQPDVLCVQETKATAEQFETQAVRDLGYDVQWHAAVKPGYSGVATFSRGAAAAPPGTTVLGLGEARFDDEGRVLVTRHGDVTVINAYFPNAQRDLGRLDYKTDFYRAMLAFAERRRAAGETVVICGDWNTAHRAIDIENWRGNQKASGFTPGERALVDEYLAAGWVDVFRALHPELARQYSWWSNRPGVREKNVGWRIDYHVVAAETMPRVRAARIHMEVLGSDHCPVELALD